MAGLVAMLITDSFHLPHDILKTIVRAKGKGSANPHTKRKRCARQRSAAPVAFTLCLDHRARVDTMSLCTNPCQGVERVLVTSDIAKFGGMEPGDYEWLGATAEAEGWQQSIAPMSPCLVFTPVIYVCSVMCASLACSAV